MVAGRNKKLGKKGRGKKTVDPFLHKEWFDIKAPTIFESRTVGKTLVTKSQGKHQAFRKIRMICEDVQGSNCLLNFHGMNFTTDKLRSMVKKWQTLIEAHVDVKTTDGYYLRLFCIGFTKKANGQRRRTAYAQSAQVRKIRKVMMERMAKEASAGDFKGLCKKFMAGAIGQDITKACNGIYPLKDVYVRKVKVLKKPKFDYARLMENHGESSGTASAAGGKVARSGDFVEPLPSDDI
eukprot:Awhi_evm1s1157